MRAVKVLSAVIVLVALSSFAMADSISPTSVTKTLGIGESYTVSKTVTVDKGAPTSSKVDVFFLADTTGSMGGPIAAVKAAASTILTNTAGLGDVAFGVGEYRDIFDAFTYRLNTDITTSQAAAQAGINLWNAGGGGDFYEANMFALEQVATTSTWRAGSERLLVWFGDAPGHDPRAGSTEASATAALLAEGISVHALDASSLDLTGQATRLAAATGGTYTAGVTSGNIVAIIQAAITTAIETYTHVGIDGTEAPIGVNVAIAPSAGWSGSFDRSATLTYHFDVTFTGVSEGAYTFNLYGTVDGGRVATEVDNITVTAVPLPASAWLGLTLLGSLGAFRSMRRRRKAA